MTRAHPYALPPRAAPASSASTAAGSAGAASSAGALIYDWCFSGSTNARTSAMNFVYMIYVVCLIFQHVVNIWPIEDRALEIC